MKVRIRLDTMTDIANFVLIANSTSKAVLLTDNENLCVDGKSFLGLAYSREFNDLWCETEANLYTQLQPYIVTDTPSN